MVYLATPPLALLGGTFDPVHYGHLRIADEARRLLGLSRVALVPASDPPHRSRPVASAADRLAMLRLAVAEFPGLSVDERELTRKGKSYTVATLEELRSEDTLRPLLLLLGADAYRGLAGWHRWSAIFVLAHVVVIARPGTALDALPAALAMHAWQRTVSDSRVLRTTPAGAIYFQPVTPQPISASAIRDLLAGAPGPPGPIAAAALHTLLPAAVLSYIVRNQLYTAEKRPDAP